MVWFREDVTIVEDNRTRISVNEDGRNQYSVILELNDVVETDAGLYKVKAKNKYGEVSASINLNFSRKYFYFFSIWCYCYSHLILWKLPYIHTSILQMCFDIRRSRHIWSMEFTTLRSTQRENSKVSKYPSSSNYFAIFDPPADVRLSDVFHALENFSELKFQSCEMHWQLARITEYENSAKIQHTADIHWTKICLNIFDR